MFFPPASSTVTEDALLIGPDGFDVTHRRKGGPACSAPQPGTVVPNWPSAAGCTCEGVIKGKTPHSPYGTTQIINCPMTKPRVVWAWFTLDARPVVFMETQAAGDERGALLALVDYHTWVPDLNFPDAAFAKPAQCTARNGREQVPRAVRAPCFACHLGPSR
jgi:hypothetical protein